MVHGHLSGKQVGGVEFDAHQLLGGGDVIGFQLSFLGCGLFLGLGQFCFGGKERTFGLDFVHAVVQCQFLGGHFGCLTGAAGLQTGLIALLLQRVQLCQRLPQRCDFCFCAGQQPGLVVPAPVQCSTQALFCFQIRGRFVTGGNQRGDALFQFGILINGQGVLPDKRAALKHGAGHTGQPLAGILAGHALYLCGGAGVCGVKPPHGRAAVYRVADQYQLLGSVSQFHTAAHGSAVPGNITVFIGQSAPLTGGQAIEHGTEKRQPSGFAGFVGGLNQVQTFLQLQRAIVQTAKCGCKRM